MNKSILLALFIAAPLANAADAVVKLVIGTASAKPNTSLPKHTYFSTKQKSRAEIAFAGGTVRTGSDTQVWMADDNAIQLHKGIALIASKPKLFRSSVQVSTPNYGMKVRGTAQIYHDPGRSIRIVALEGTVSVSLNSVRGESITLKRGQELIINPADKQLPTPVEVDLNRLMATMSLLDRATFPALPSSGQIETCAQQQETELVSGEELDSTGLLMETAGPELEMLPEEIVHEDVHDEIPDLNDDGEDDPDTGLDENGIPLDDPSADATAVADAAAADEANNADTTAADTPEDAPPPPGQKRSASSLRRKVPGIALNHQRLSADQVRLGSSTTRARIQITNSSEVAAIAGALHAMGNGGTISVDGSTLKAASEILLDTGTATSGLVQLKDATLNASSIRARAFATGGNALIIDGSTLNADQLIKLYAEGAGTLRFRNNVTLNTNQAIIAGKTVEVDAGGNVNVRGKADIYTDNANFNRTGYGNISAGGGALTHPHAARPGF